MSNPNLNLPSLDARYASAKTYHRGMNTQGGDANGTDGSQVPGTQGVNYWYNSQAHYDYLASRGHTIVRIGFLWERVQHSLNGPLDSTGVTELKTVIQRAVNSGLSVILDMKNYGRYWVNSSSQAVLGNGITSTWFANVWSQLATALANVPGNIGYGLMNEPHDLGPNPNGTTTWKQFSQAAVTAIRATGDTRDIYVAGDQWGGAWGWTNINGAPWITDPYTARDAIVYEAHLYMDHDRSGTYASGSYATEESADIAGGWLSLPARVVADCNVFTSWLAAYGKRGFIGEMGWPSTFDTSAWNSAAQQALTALNTAGIGVTFWASGEHLSNGSGGIYLEDVYNQANFIPQSQALIIEAAQNMSSPSTQIGAAKAIESLAKAQISGAWNFAQAPTVAGSPISGSSTPDYTIASGSWWTPSASGTGTGSLSSTTTAVLSPIRLPASMNLSSLAIEVTTAASAGGVLRAAFYALGTNGLPGSLISDLGTIDATTTGMKTWTLGSSVALPAGLVWFALIAQTAPCSIRTTTGANETALPLPSGVAPSAGVNIEVLNLYVSSTFPASASGAGAGTILIAPPKMYIKAA